MFWYLFCLYIQNLALRGDDEKEEQKKRFKVVKNQHGSLGLVVLDGAQSPEAKRQPQFPNSDPLFGFPADADRTGKTQATERTERNRRGN